MTLFFFNHTRKLLFNKRENTNFVNVYIVIYFLFIYFGVTEERSLKGGGAVA